ncbi:hypothetical protein Spb1_32770 [Planctopirus ephydatiae]|uniref:Uncharacterized protein n=1 Tax=Planctopirus ephydatiae TaxID=2528019 RepID=A0A518GRW7_9PLAN|nr:hypothetical protein Spb1_32770 [Planctopirus ephydatiae]
MSWRLASIALLDCALSQLIYTGNRTESTSCRKLKFFDIDFRWISLSLSAYLSVDTNQYTLMYWLA